jgi:hypothetical protein
MVKGIDLFAKHFDGFQDSFVLIGGTACDLWMKTLGQPFRSTKDLDIVIIMEALNSDFVNRFWEFVRVAKYQTFQESTGKNVFYRFQKPEIKEYPFMLELFAKSPFEIPTNKMSALTPIPTDDDVSSLSAILLDEGYYNLIKSLRVREINNNLPIIPAIGLIPLKVKAWLDLTQQSRNGLKVDEWDIKKHRNDIFRLVRTLTETDKIDPSVNIKYDISTFVTRMNQLNESEHKNIAQAINISNFDFTLSLKRIFETYCIQV